MLISGNDILLDILSEYPQTLAIIRDFERDSDTCICCDYLFATLREIAAECNINQTELLNRLNRSRTQGD